MQERIQDMADGLRVFVHDEEFISWKDVCKITSLEYRTLLELYKNGFFVKPYQASRVLSFLVKLFWSGINAR
jgi:hypothetical protein